MPFSEFGREGETKRAVQGAASSRAALPDAASGPVGVARVRLRAAAAAGARRGQAAAEASSRPPPGVLADERGGHDHVSPPGRASPARARPGDGASSLSVRVLVRVRLQRHG